MSILKVFEASYDLSHGRGNFTEGHGVVVANSEAEALGLCLQDNEETVACGWSLSEVSTSELSCSAFTVDLQY